MPDSTSDNRLSIIDSLIKWKETYELSFELAEISHILLIKLADYCNKHNIPFYKERGTLNLVDRAGRIFKLIQEINSPNYKPQNFAHIRRKNTDFKSDNNDTEPDFLNRIFHKVLR